MQLLMPDILNNTQGILVIASAQAKGAEAMQANC